MVNTADEVHSDLAALGSIPSSCVPPPHVLAVRLVSVLGVPDTRTRVTPAYEGWIFILLTLSTKLLSYNLPLCAHLMQLCLCFFALWCALHEILLSQFLLVLGALLLQVLKIPGLQV